MGIFAAIFKPNDGTRRALVERVTEAREKMEAAASRLDEIVTQKETEMMDKTIAELLEENDRVTGRKKPNGKKPST